MAGEAIIRLRIDPATGRKTIYVQYESDPDALPIEHEQEHKALIQALLGAHPGATIERLAEKSDIPGPQAPEVVVAGEALATPG